VIPPENRRGRGRWHFLCLGGILPQTKKKTLYVCSKGKGQGQGGWRSLGIPSVLPLEELLQFLVPLDLPEENPGGNDEGGGGNSSQLGGDVGRQPGPVGGHQEGGLQIAGGEEGKDVDEGEGDGSTVGARRVTIAYVH
jgi:hypothetical protein